MQALLTSFNNEYGEDGSARRLKALYDRYNLDNPPKLAQYNNMLLLEKVIYYPELKDIEDRALAVEALYEELITINPGSGEFGTLTAVKTWAINNIGLAGVEVEKDCNVLAAIRVTLIPFVQGAMLLAHSDAITAFRDKVTEQISELGTG